jgi:hypothetical protein
MRRFIQTKFVFIRVRPWFSYTKINSRLTLFLQNA